MEIPAIADTGSQTCTAGNLGKLNCSENELIKTKHRLRAVNDEKLSIKGALIVNISHGQHSSSEILYICQQVNGIYLSQTALKKLQIIPEEFLNKIAGISSSDNKIVPLIYKLKKRQRADALPDQHVQPSPRPYRTQQRWNIEKT